MSEPEKKKKRRRRRRSNKGPPFERVLCRQLSLWWSKGQADDLFWRTAGSGGRATRRGRAGKRTAGACGDLCSTCPESAAFCEVFTTEIKRGYSRATVADLLDKGPTAAKQVYEDWFRQARESAKHAGTPLWLLIHKRDQRVAVVFFPGRLLDLLDGINTDLLTLPSVCLSLRRKSKWVYGVRLDHFLESLPAAAVRRLARKLPSPSRR